MRYINAEVNDIEEGLVRQLLNSELCTTETDLKEFVSMAYSHECIHQRASFNMVCASSSCRMSTLPLAVCFTCWHLSDVTRQLSGCLGTEHMYMPGHM